MPKRSSSPKTGLQILTNMEPPTLAEWLDLAEWRRNQLIPHLPSMNLEALGSLRCMRSSFSRQLHALNDDLTIAPWGMRGIFDVIPRPKCSDRTQSISIWGLTASHEWVVVYVKVMMEPVDDDFTGKESERVIGYQIESEQYGPSLTALNVCELTTTSPRRMNRVLAKSIKAFAEQKASEHHDAQRLLQSIHGEEAALHARGVKIR